MVIMYLFGFVLWPRKPIYHCMWNATVCNSFTMGCPPVRGNNTRAVASGLSYGQVDKHGIIYFYYILLYDSSFELSV